MKFKEKFLEKVKVLESDEVKELPSFKALNMPTEHITSYKEVIRFPKEGSFDGPITIVPISDVHLGSNQFNLRKFQETIDYILETPSCFTILLGDQAETATKSSVGLGVFEENMHIAEQIAMLYRMLKPLADAGKIIGVLTGNHEMRVACLTSLNPAELVADQLGVPYLGYQGYISLRVGEQTYGIVAFHGAGGGATPAGKLNAMRKMNRVALADLYISGHTHAKLTDHDILMEMNHETLMVERKKIHYAVCGSFLEYWNGYPEMKGLPAVETGCIEIKFEADEKYIKVTI